jgi:hypothetical protein
VSRDVPIRAPLFLISTSQREAVQDPTRIVFCFVMFDRELPQLDPLIDSRDLVVSGSVRMTDAQ